jgi:hypothetical protein
MKSDDPEGVRLNPRRAGFVEGLRLKFGKASLLFT